MFVRCYMEYFKFFCFFLKKHASIKTLETYFTFEKSLSSDGLLIVKFFPLVAAFFSDGNNLLFASPSPKTGNILITLNLQFVFFDSFLISLVNLALLKEYADLGNLFDFLLNLSSLVELYPYSEELLIIK